MSHFHENVQDWNLVFYFILPISYNSFLSIKGRKNDSILYQMGSYFSEIFYGSFTRESYDQCRLSLSVSSSTMSFEIDFGPILLDALSIFDIVLFLSMYLHVFKLNE
jgi:hypothetical protein